VVRRLTEILGEAEAKIERLEPSAACEAMAAGALLVDIRGDAERARDGVVPGSLHVPRTVLEWRFDPAGAWRNVAAADVTRQVVLLCDHGYSSILAAAVLADLGYARAGDVIGGFEAWLGAGLPVAPAPPRPAGLPGMGQPPTIEATPETPVVSSTS
jgi:rhodanese-related sulfurtransferase